MTAEKRELASPKDEPLIVIQLQVVISEIIHIHTILNGLNRSYLCNYVFVRMHKSNQKSGSEFESEQLCLEVHRMGGREERKRK